MKKVLFALAWGFALISCGTVYDTYDGDYGYNSYGDYSYGYGHDYIIYNNGYRYGYEAGVIDAITNRMVMAMALDQIRAARLLELNRRYFYIFSSMPNYSWGYYHFTPGPPSPPAGPVGPGYYGGSNRPPYGGGYGNYTGRGMGGYRSNYDVNMTERDLQNAAREYTRGVRSIVGNDNYTVFENRVRTDAKAANQKVNAVRENPEVSTRTRVRTNNNSNTTTTPTTSGTRVRTNNNSSTTTTTPTTSGTRVRTNNNSNTTTTPATSGTRVRTNNNSNTTTTPTTSGTRVRTNNNSNTTTTPTTSGTRVRTNNNSNNTTTPTTSGTRVRTNNNSSGSSTTTTTNTNTSTRTRTR